MRRALGRGLSQLLGDEAESQGRLATVPIERIRPNPRQPRKAFDADSLAELAASIREHGILQPLVVRPLGEERWELISGERRLRASRLAGLKEVPVIERSASAQVSLELAIIENVQREDISAIESAMAYRLLIEEFSLTQDEVARKVGKSRAAVANTLRLLKLPEEMQEAIAEGAISEGHARALLMADSPMLRERLFQKILREGLTVRDAERLARGEEGPKPERAPASAKPKSSRASAPLDAALEQALSERLGAPVRLERQGPSGRVVIEFFSEEELTAIADSLGVSL
jgi:ParB family chromosome partitioning protein